MTLRSDLAILAIGPWAIDFAAANAGAGAEIDDRIGGTHRVFVVLDDDDRVAFVAQLAERFDQLRVVARMQADRGFVENVKDADQAAADLTGEANSLRFAARERGGGAIEREIFEADVDEETEAAADFFDGFFSDFFAGGVEDKIVEELSGVADGQRADVGQRSLGSIGEFWVGGRDRDTASLRIEPSAVAGGAGDHAHVFFELAGLHLAVGAAMAVEQLRDDAFEMPAVFRAMRAAAPGERDVLIAGAVEPDFLQRGIELAPRRFEHRAGFKFAKTLDRVGDALIDVATPAAHVAPGADEFDRTLGEREIGIGDETLRIEGVDFAEAVALRAHALRAVEAEKLRAGRIEAEAAMGAGVMGGECEVGVRRAEVGMRGGGFGFSFFGGFGLLARFRRRFFGGIR